MGKKSNRYASVGTNGRITESTRTAVQFLAISSSVAVVVASVSTRIIYLMVIEFTRPDYIYWVAVWLLNVVFFTKLLIWQLLEFALAVATLDGVSDMVGSEHVRVGRGHLVRRFAKSSE